VRKKLLISSKRFSAMGYVKLGLHFEFNGNAKEVKFIKFNRELDSLNF